MKLFLSKMLFLQFLLFFSTFAQDALKLKTLEGVEIIPFADDLARISNIVYKEYPYLYDVEDDAEFYLTKFCHSPEAKLCLVYDGQNSVGYAIGLPLKAYSSSFQQPFFDFGIDVENFFYLGEIALLPEYRERGIGKRMLSEMEAMVMRENKYSNMCLVHIDESQILEKSPVNYASHATFWLHFGYKQYPNLSFTQDWKNVGAPNVSSHTLIYWIKPLEIY